MEKSTFYKVAGSIIFIVICCAFFYTIYLVTMNSGPENDVPNDENTTKTETYQLSLYNLFERKSGSETIIVYENNRFSEWIQWGYFSYMQDTYLNDNYIHTEMWYLKGDNITIYYLPKYSGSVWSLSSKTDRETFLDYYPKMEFTINGPPNLFHSNLTYPENPIPPTYYKQSWDGTLEPTKYDANYSVQLQKGVTKVSVKCYSAQGTESRGLNYRLISGNQTLGLFENVSYGEKVEWKNITVDPFDPPKIYVEYSVPFWDPLFGYPNIDFDDPLLFEKYQEAKFRIVVNVEETIFPELDAKMGIYRTFVIEDPLK